MRHRVIIQKLVKIPDGVGGNEDTYQDIATVWARIEPLNAVEKFYAHQLSNEITYRINIRYRSDIDETMRMKYGNRIFEIESIIDTEERHKSLELYCREAK